MSNLNKTRVKSAIATAIALSIILGSLADPKIFAIVVTIAMSVLVTACIYNMFFICFESSNYND